ncbi:hemolysin-III related-domain-containing protein [Mycena haematopus]|nr:hemolysin-III related-domain-containing protein [Mycena haematopus]
MSLPARPRRPRRMSAPPAAPPRLSACGPLSPSLEALDLCSTSPTAALASLRVVVLSYLADLEQRICALGGPASALDLLHAIRADINSHLPDVKGLVASIDFKRPLSYVPVLADKIKSLHAHLADEFDFDFDFDFPRPSAPPVLREMFDALRADVDAFLADLPSLSPPLLFADADADPATFPSQADALARSDNGRRLINYADLPFDWRNNPWVVSGYRFIPLTHWPRLVLSLFQLHNETLNIHTHLLPMLAWGLAFYGVSVPFPSGIAVPFAAWLRPLAPWLEWLAYPLGDWARYTPFAAWSSPLPPLSPFSQPHAPPDPAETLFTLFALLTLLASALWHTAAGCAHLRTMETCARIDYVGIGWLISVSVGTIVRWGYGCVVEEVEEALASHHLPAGVRGLVEEVELEVGGAVGRMLNRLGALPFPSFLFPFTAPLYVVAGWVERGAALLMRPLGALGSLPIFDFLPLPSLRFLPSLFPSLTMESLETTLESLTSHIASFPSYHPLGAACLALCAAAGLAGNILPFCAWFNRVEHRLWRLAFFVGISFSAIAPMAGIVVLQGWGVMWRFVAPITPSLLYYLVGLTIYAAQVPERWFGGGPPPPAPRGWVGWASDMCGGGSHALWHIFIVLAMRAHRDGIREMRRVAGEGGCVVRG